MTIAVTALAARTQTVGIAAVDAEACIVAATGTAPPRPGPAGFDDGAAPEAARAQLAALTALAATLRASNDAADALRRATHGAAVEAALAAAAERVGAAVTAAAQATVEAAVYGKVLTAEAAVAAKRVADAAARRGAAVAEEAALQEEYRSLVAARRK